MYDSVDGTNGPGRLAVTYANDKLTDGVGAQLQRICGVYAISRFLGIPYVHSAIIRVGYQGLMALEGNSLDPDPNFPDAFNALFKFPTDIEPPAGGYDIAEIDNASLTIIDDLRRKADAEGRQILARIFLPYGITDQYPESYEACRAISPFGNLRRDGPLKIALHVRRGEIIANAPERLLSNSYYIGVAKRICELLDKKGVEYRIELHTEVSTRDIVIHPGHPVLNDAISKPIIINAAENQITEFDILPHLSKRINEPAIDCLYQMAAADVIVMSRSSFSYVAAIFSKKTSIVVYHPFWHAPMQSWIRASPEGCFDEQTFLQRIPCK